MSSYVVAVGLILFLFAGWLLVQFIVRAFAARHPEFGPAREEGGGCGKSCLCKNGGSCERKGRRE